MEEKITKEVSSLQSESILSAFAEQDKIDLENMIKEAEENKTNINKNPLDNTDKSLYGRERRRTRSVEGFQSKLYLEERYKKPGYQYRWVRGEPSRIQQMQRNDWELVIDPELAKEKGSGDTLVSVYVGKNQNGSSRRDVLMMIPEKWFNEDQQAKLKKLEEMDHEMELGNFGHAKDIETRYIPSEVTRINRKV